MANTCFNTLVLLGPPSKGLKTYLTELSMQCYMASKKQEGINVVGVEDKSIFDLSLDTEGINSCTFSYATKWTTSKGFAEKLATLFPQDTFEILFEEYGCHHAGIIRVNEGLAALYYVRDSFWEAMEKHDASNSREPLPSIEEHLDENPADTIETFAGS